MSFCRVGDQSDIHAFQAGEGYFVVQVARNRSPSLSDAQADALSMTQMLEWMKNSARPIGGRCDGQEFQMGTAAELVDLLRDLLLLGYQVAPDTWENIERDHPGVVPPALLPVLRPRTPMPH